MTTTCCAHAADDHDAHGCLDPACPCLEATPGRTITYCDDCGRIRGVGCACGLSFAEKIRTVAPQVPDNMRAVPRR